MLVALCNAAVVNRPYGVDGGFIPLGARDSSVIWVPHLVSHMVDRVTRNHSIFGQGQVVTHMIGTWGEEEGWCLPSAD